MAGRPKIPFVRLLEWIEGSKARALFSSGKVIELKLPVTDASDAHVVDGGMGIDPGNGMEISAAMLAEMRGKVWTPGRRGWIGYVQTNRSKR